MAKFPVPNNLLVRIVIAIVAGIALSFVMPEPIARVFATFNGLFGNFLGFFVPVLIFSLITPAIAGLGRGAGKWLAATTVIAYGSTVVAGFVAYIVAQATYPTLLGGENNVASVSDISEGSLNPYFEVEMAPPFEVITALLLAFSIGVAMTAVKSDILYKAADELCGIIMKIIESFVIPLLPIFIFGLFLDLGMNGNLTETLSTFSKVLVLAIVLTIAYLLVQYLVAGAIAGRNPFSALKNMAPAYFTALGTSSSAATIPVTLKATLANGVRKEVAGFVVPLCATIHLSGSMVKIMLFSFAIVHMTGMNVPLGLALGFILMLAITMVAGPGVPGGAIMAALGVLSSMLGFDESMLALMIAAYIAIDSFGTAANVAGDGAIAMVVNRFTGRDLEREQRFGEEATAVA